MNRPNSSHTGKRKKNRGRAGRKDAGPRLSDEMREELEKRLDYQFKDDRLLDIALTHTSAVPGDAARSSNERLEFLGDRVLGLVIAQELLKRFETEREGGLAPRLNGLVNRQFCADRARDIGLQESLIVDAAGRAGSGPKESLLADAMEAVIGAVYLDGGLLPAERLIQSLWKVGFKDVAQAPRDPKSQLQEELQGAGKSPPQYELVEREGPDHAPMFRVAVSVDGGQREIGEGRSKQDAERAAAKAMLMVMGADT